MASYVAYRSVVRAKVRGLELREREIGEERRAASLAKSKAHFLLALGELEEPQLRPLLVLIGGLPGTGKSTLARGLAEQQDFCVIRSDVVGKELAGVAPRCPLGRRLARRHLRTRLYARTVMRSACAAPKRFSSKASA